ncbi:YfhO family protein, partial [Peptostreptococcaceae bacterium OttesenSCG-928-C18]|nr:YfhO family protein [Peptostreptococcaceae bacterium OttesenSCG-928-C18]
GIILVPITLTINYSVLHNYRFWEMITRMSVDFKLVLSRLFFYTEPSIVIENFPNIYMGVINLPLVLFYFISKEEPKKNRIVNALLVSLFIASFSLGLLNYVWNGFRMPNGIPFRFAFTFIFFFISLSYKGYLIFTSNINIKNIIIISISFFLIVIIKIYSCSFTIDRYLKYNLILLFLYFILLFVYKLKISKYMIYSLLTIELILNFNNYVNKIGFSNYNDYNNNVYEYNELKASLPKNEFFREEFLYFNTDNDPALYKYKGLSLFSSDISKNWLTFGELVGLASDTSNNKLIYSDNTPIINSFFNINYLYANTNNHSDKFKNIRQVKNDLYLYENNYPLSLGFKVKNINKDSKLSSNSVFENQSALLYSATGINAEYFTKAPRINESFVSIDKITRDELLNYTSFTEKIPGKFTYDYEIPADGKVYVHANAKPLVLADGYIYERRISVTNNGNTKYYNFIRPCIYDLGYYKKGDVISLSGVLANNSQNHTLEISVSVINEDKIMGALNILDKEKLNIVEYTSNSVLGEIQGVKDEILFTSILDSDNWEVYINGLKKDKEILYDTFIGVRLEDGKNTIEFKYIPKNFKIGFIVSLIGISLFISKNIFLKIKISKSKNKKMLQ